MTDETDRRRRPGAPDGAPGRAPDPADGGTPPPSPRAAGASSAADAKPAPGPKPAPETKPAPRPKPAPGKVPEIGGPSGPEPTRYGDWERKGRCIDF